MSNLSDNPKQTTVSLKATNWPIGARSGLARLSQLDGAVEGGEAHRFLALRRQRPPVLWSTIRGMGLVRNRWRGEEVCFCRVPFCRARERRILAPRSAMQRGRERIDRRDRAIHQSRVGQPGPRDPPPANAPMRCRPSAAAVQTLGQAPGCEFGVTPQERGRPRGKAGRRRPSAASPGPCLPIDDTAEGLANWLLRLPPSNPMDAHRD